MAVKLIDELQKEIKAAGEAVTQEAYEKAYDHVFQILDNLEKLLNDNRYLEGNEITEEDKVYRHSKMVMRHSSQDLRQWTNGWRIRDSYSEITLQTVTSACIQHLQDLTTAIPEISDLAYTDW